MAKKKCDNCLRKAQATTTGGSPRNATLKIDMGGAVFYVMPGPNGEIEVTLNAENIILGNYIYCYFDGKQWFI